MWFPVHTNRPYSSASPRSTRLLMMPRDSPAAPGSAVGLIHALIDSAVVACRSLLLATLMHAEPAKLPTWPRTPSLTGFAELPDSAPLSLPHESSTGLPVAGHEVSSSFAWKMQPRARSAAGGPSIIDASATDCALPHAAMAAVTPLPATTSRD